MSKTALTSFILLLLFQFCFSKTKYKDYLTPYVHHIGINEGLPSLWITDIVQDDYDVLWFGTWNGLVSYDGSRIKEYNTNNEKTLINNMITSIVKRDNGDLWVGSVGSFVRIFDKKLQQFLPLQFTGDSAFLKESVLSFCFSEEYAYIGTTKGLLRYNLHTRLLEMVLPNDEINNSKLRVQTMIRTGNGILWVGTLEGLYLIDEKTLTIVKDIEETVNYSMIKSVNCFHIDEYNRIWIGTKFGLFLYNQAENYLIPFNYDKNKKFSISNNNIKTIAGDNTGNLIIGTEKGLNLFNFDQVRFYPIEGTNTLLKHQINDNSFTSLLIDDTGIIWIGTFNGGINYFKPSYKGINHISVNNNGLISPYVLDVYEDRDKNIWLGTENGLMVYDSNFKDHKSFFIKDKKNNKEAKIIKDVFIDEDNELWILIYETGIERYKINETGLTQIKMPQEIYNKIHNLRINSIIDITRHVILLGTENGVRVYDKKNEKLFDFNEYFNVNLDVVSVHDMYFSRSTNELLVAGKPGVNLLNFDNYSVEKYYPLLSDTEKRVNDLVYSVIKDSYGNIWMGSSAGLGLISSNGSYIDIMLKTGLAYDHIKNVFEDIQGNIWFTTAQELIKIPPESIVDSTFDYLYFTPYDGLMKGEFKSNSYYRSESGRIYIGGSDGLNYFYPENLKKNTDLPKVLFTYIKIRGKELPSEEDALLKQSIKGAELLKLKHNQTNITIGFTCLNYLIPQKNRFAYILEGLENEWNYIEDSKEVSFLQLPPGKFTLKVKASNNDGVWNEQGVSLQIEVLPPWHKTLWFKGVVILIIILVVILFIKLKTHNLKKQKEYLERRVNEKTSELTNLNEKLIAQNNEIKIQKEQIEQYSSQLHESDQKKLRFFTNISHEFRTPLSLILDPLDSLLKKAKENQMTELSLIRKNAKVLLKLIDQLIDIRKIDQGLLELKIAEQKLDSLIEEIIEIFRPTAKNNNLEILFKKPEHTPKTYFDQDKIEKVVINLVSNAIKYSNKGGKVNITLAYKKENHKDLAVIEVADQGIGIPQKDRDKLFTRFFKATNTEKFGKDGIGIGLSYCKELITIHKGFIEVESTEGEGSVFTVLFPINKEEYSEKIVHKENSEVSDEVHGLNETYLSLTNDSESEIVEDSDIQVVETNVIKDKKAPVILIVEDNQDLRNRLVAGLMNFGNIYVAENGLTGAELAFGIIPDIIVSDILMPCMNGLELCEKIKKETRTSHIPVILLTAKSGTEAELEGLLKGADDYIVKPFIMDVLVSKVKNILEQKKQLWKYFDQMNTVKPDQTFSSTDEKFLKYLTATIEENMHNQDFSIENFSSQLRMDRFQLYRKIHSLTGLSPSKYVTRIRLNKALELLQKHKASVSEVAFEVGFNSSSYFSQCFKEIYGVKPSQYNEVILSRSVKERSINS